MTNLDEIKDKKTSLYNAVTDALASGNTEQIKASMEALQEFNKAELKSIYDEYEQNRDEAILESRGIKALTSEETKFWNSFIDDAKSRFNNAVQGTGVYTGLMELLPKSEYWRIVEELKRDHELLSAINFTATSAVTKWHIDNSPEQRATWHALNTPITKELEGGPFLEIDMTLCKLTAFIVVSNDMLDLGPRWVAAYATTLIKEALAIGLEYAIIAGNGKDEPIGMITDYHADFNNTTGYPVRPAKKIRDFSKETFAELLATMSIKDNGRTRGISSVILVVNPVDFFTKIYPNTTSMTYDFTYKNNIFPFPTRVIQSTVVPKDHAVIGVASDFFMGLGSAKGGKLEYSDEYRFLEDQRTYKIKLYGNGRPLQYNGFVYCDITDVQEVLPVIATTDKPANAYLASLTLGNIELTPEFDKLRKDYTADVTVASAAISAVAKDSNATVVIKNGNTTVQEGGTVSFAKNSTTKLVITVTNGDVESVYTLTVKRGNE